METLANLPIRLFQDQTAWNRWLTDNHTQTTGVWLKIAKKTSGKTSVSYTEALEEALCYGWIDGQKRAYDEWYFLQKFTPRRPRSVWSKVNVGKVEALTGAGRMQPAGLAEVAKAKTDGRWAAAYDSSSNMTVPTDFQAALDANPQAKEFFGSLNKTNVYAFIWRINNVKKAETRATKIQQFVAMLERGEKLY